MPEKDVRYYLRLPYTRRVEIRKESEPVYFVASIEEIPFIQTDGDTPEEALARLNELFVDCLEDLVGRAEEIAEPELWPGTGARAGEILALPFPPSAPAQTIVQPSSTVARVGKMPEGGVSVGERLTFELVGTA